MCTYEMDQVSVVEDREWTRFHPQTDGQTDGRMDRRMDGERETSIYPFQLCGNGGYENVKK